MATNPGTRKGVSDQTKIVQDKLLDDLNSSIADQARRSTFACGGSVPIKGTDTQESDTVNVDPVQIRFGEQGQGFLVTLPCESIDSVPVQALLAACTPASFGRGSREVLDEDYRKAGKLDTSAFMTNFNPYECGIIDVISQLLLPSSRRDKDKRAVRAELYKLNVYSAPSGKFKAHVDTPRSEDQFGSLVVALPVAHEGGELLVRNAGKEVVFDWSTSSESELAVAKTASDGTKKVKVAGVSAPVSIKWAALYSDCEHEVLEVTSGHRITLTYNLYVTRGSGHLAGQAPMLDPTQLPLYTSLKAAVENPGFLQGGRVLGTYLKHSYAHTNAATNFLPHSLKGADMVLYETARALGLHCYVRPVVSVEWTEYDSGDEIERDMQLYNDRFQEFNTTHAVVVSGDNTPVDVVKDYWNATEVDEAKVTWLGSGVGAEEAALGYGTYGNEPGMNVAYSRAVLFIRVPPFSMRGTEKEPPVSMFDGIASDEPEEFDADEEMQNEEGHDNDAMEPDVAPFPG